MSKDYERKVAAGLQKAYEEATHASFNVEKDKWVIFSDQHRGKRDGADDFRTCEKAYNAALGYYFERGYTLVVLGDAEELWECSPKDVTKAYENTLHLEAEFHNSGGRYLRFYGNHDSDWKRPSVVERHLKKFFGPKLEVNEAMRLRVLAAGDRLGEIFLVHGHQGTLDSDEYSTISRFAVRYGWGFIQRWLKIRSTTPAKSFTLRHKHNIAMYRWAASKPEVVLIAGHTHRPVFASRNKVAILQGALAEVRRQLQHAGSDAPRELIDQAAAIRAQLEAARVQEVAYESGELPINQQRPCYFNTGCCSFSDGDVTALEIADGRIALVRWPDDKEEPKPHVLASEDLRVVFNKVGTPAPQPAHAGGTQ
jgi:predicted phosphodiesterase